MVPPDAQWGEILNIYYTGSGSPTPYTNGTEWAKMGRGGEMGQSGLRKAGDAVDGIRHRGIKLGEPLQKCVPPAGPEAVEQGAQL